MSAAGGGAGEGVRSIRGRARKGVGQRVVVVERGVVVRARGGAAEGVKEEAVSKMGAG